MRRRRLVFFIAALAFALVALLPLSLAASWFGGLTAREAEGTLWYGRLREARFGPVALGDIDARLNLLPLFLGRARLSLSRDEADGRLDGALSVSRHGFGIDDLTGEIRPGGALAPLPLARLDFDRLSVRFENGLCESAEGAVGAGPAGELIGSSLRGGARCAEGALLLPLASQAGTEQVELRIGGDGRWRADLSVRVSEPAASARLAAAGFSLAPNGAYVRRIEGSF